MITRFLRGGVAVANILLWSPVIVEGVTVLNKVYRTKELVAQGCFDEESLFLFLNLHSLFWGRKLMLRCISFNEVVRALFITSSLALQTVSSLRTLSQNGSYLDCPPVSH